MSYVVYILYSVKIDKYYVGYTNNIERRLFEHNRRKGKYTDRGMPWTLVYIEDYPKKEEAMGREAPNLHGTHLFFGGKDEHIISEYIEITIAAVKKAEKDYINVVFLSADHGFHCDERASYHPLVTKEAWALALAFFLF